MEMGSQPFRRLFWRLRFPWCIFILASMGLSDSLVHWTLCSHALTVLSGCVFDTVGRTACCQLKSLVVA